MQLLNKKLLIAKLNVNVAWLLVIPIAHRLVHRQLREAPLRVLRLDIALHLVMLLLTVRALS